MVEMLSFDTKIMIGILGPFLLAIGYFYRSRQESKKNKKIALYTLMEIWHRTSIFYVKDFDSYFKQLFLEIKRQFPNEKMTVEEIDMVKAHVMPILIETLRTSSLSDLDGYEQKYEDAILLIASDDPVFAYKLHSVSKTRDLLVSLDSYLNKSFKCIEKNRKAEESVLNIFKSHISEYAQIESIGDLESDIRRLSYNISLYTYFSCIKAIRRRRMRLGHIDNNEIENLVTNVLLPIMNKLNQGEQPPPNDVR